MVTQIKNEGFKYLQEEFTKENWLLDRNEPDHISFKSQTSDYDYFEIDIDNKKINVTIPLKNSTYKYKTSFDSYFNASEYIEMHLQNFTTTQ